MEPRINITILDDHPMILSGLKELLKKCTFAESVTGFNNIARMKEYVLTAAVDLAILDLRISNTEGGLEMANFMRSKLPNTKILIYTAHVDRSYISECVDIGVDAYVTKDSDVEEVSSAIRYVLQGERYYSKDVKDIVLNHFFNQPKVTGAAIVTERLTSREVEVLKLVCKGFDSKQIGEKLFISQNTVRKHRQNILIKTNCHNVQSLYQYAIRNRFVYPRV